MTTNSKHQGIFIENGSGGLISDLTFTGGNGITIGNQQFTMKALHFSNCGYAIEQIWYVLAKSF